MYKISLDFLFFFLFLFYRVPSTDPVEGGPLEVGKDPNRESVSEPEASILGHKEEIFLLKDVPTGYV